MQKHAGTIHLLLAVAALLVAARSARAESEATFDKGSFVIQATGSYVAGTAVFDTEFGSGVIGGLGVGYYFYDHWGLYAEGTALSLTHVDPETDAVGGGLSLILRWHLLEFADRRATVFAEIGGGLATLDHEWPDNGTHSNFTGRAGLGMTYRICREHDVNLVAGLRYFHLSNGYRHGEDENPNFDAGEAWAGIIFKP